MKKLIIPVVLLLSLAMAAVAYAATSYPWNDHAAPYDYLFGNHIDTHQQSQENIDDGKLGGFFYIKFTGKYEDGVPVATHADCGKEAVDCTVGWKLKGVYVEDVMLDENSGHGHPIWCVDPDDIPRAPGFSHFHWEDEPEHAGQLEEGKSYNGYLLKLTAREQFFFKHHGGFLVTPGIDTETHANINTDC